MCYGRDERPITDAEIPQPWFWYFHHVYNDIFIDILILVVVRLAFEKMKIRTAN